MKSLFYLFCFTAISLGFIPVSSGQMFDSIRVAFHSRPHLDLRLDTRNSFISNRAAKMFGLKVGLDFQGRVKTGLGYHAMIFPFEKEKEIALNGSNDTVNALLNFGYGSVYFEYVFYQRGRWELSIPVQIGFGLARYKYELAAGNLSPPYSPVILYEPAMTAQYMPVRWAGIGLGIGYRLIPLGNKALDANFNYPVYVLKIMFFPKPLFQSIFRKGKPV